MPIGENVLPGILLDVAVHDIDELWIRQLHKTGRKTSDESLTKQAARKAACRFMQNPLFRR